MKLIFIFQKYFFDYFKNIKDIEDMKRATSKSHRIKTYNEILEFICSYFDFSLKGLPSHYLSIFYYLAHFDVYMMNQFV